MWFEHFMMCIILLHQNATQIRGQLNNTSLVLIHLGLSGSRPSFHTCSSDFELGEFMVSGESGWGSLSCEMGLRATKVHILTKGYRQKVTDTDLNCNILGMTARKWYILQFEVPSYWAMALCARAARLPPSCFSVAESTCTEVDQDRLSDHFDCTIHKLGKVEGWCFSSNVNMGSKCLA